MSKPFNELRVPMYEKQIVKLEQRVKELEATIQNVVDLTYRSSINGDSIQCSEGVFCCTRSNINHILRALGKPAI